MQIYLWALKNWKELTIALIVLAITLQVNHWREKANQLDKVKAELSSCELGKKTTKEANDALQKDRDVIAARLANSKRMYSSCVSVSSTANSAPGGKQYARQDGLSTDWLLEYAAECETYRSQRIRLEEFLNNERK